MKVFGRNVPFALVFLFWHGAVCVMVIFNYSFWMRFQSDAIVTSSTQSAYVAFAVIGMAAFTFASGPLFFYSYKYGSTKKSRAVKLRLGIAVTYFTSSLPIFGLEVWILYKNQSFVSVIDTMVLALTFISWSLGSIIVWFVYMWEAARFLQSQTGANRQVMFNPRFNPHAEEVPPYLTAVANRYHPGQPAVV